MDLSALKEIGNIIAASYLSALYTITNLVITPSIPYISVDMAASILSGSGNSVWTVWGQCTADRNRVWG